MTVRMQSNISMMQQRELQLPTPTDSRKEKLTLQQELIHVSQMKRLKLRKLQLSHFEGGEDSVFGQRGLDAQLMKPGPRREQRMRMNPKSCSSGEKGCSGVHRGFNHTTAVSVYQCNQSTLI